MRLMSMNFLRSEGHSHPNYSTMSELAQVSETPVGDSDTSEALSLYEQRQLMEKENEARAKAQLNPLVLVVVNFISSLAIFVLYLISMEMVISIVLTVGCTLYVYWLMSDNVNGDFTGSGMNSVLLSFAVINPITATISMAFRRREDALTSTSVVRSTLLELYAAHAVWDWGQTPGVLDDSGRTRSTVNWLTHSDAVCTEIMHINHELVRYLTLPSTSRARHKTTPVGRREAKRTNSVGDDLYASIVGRIAHMALYCEILKREGLPPNEATRVRQWERMVLEHSEKLKRIKDYRTPQALRSFGRLFSMLLPPFYSALFAELAVTLNSLAMGIIFAVITCVALTGLFETVSQFEDPFIPSSVLDGVQSPKEFVGDFEKHILTMRGRFFPKAAPFKQDSAKCSILVKQSQVSIASNIRLLSED